MNAYIIHIDEAGTDPSARWTMFTVPGVGSIKHDDRTASLYSVGGEQEPVLTGVVRLSESMSVILANEPPHLGGIPEAPVRTVPPRPVITAISPASGRLGGGTQVDIQGENLLDASGVFFGTAPAQAFTVVSPGGSIRATSPRGAGSAHVTVVTPGGISAMTAADEFQYQDPGPPPRIHSTEPAAGKSTGGETVAVLIQSTSLGAPPAISAFLFGAVPATSFHYDPSNPYAIPSGGRHAFNVVTPANSPGVVTLSLLTPDGGLPGTVPFTYTVAVPQPPTIAALSTQGGSAVGGTVVRIEGTGLGEATKVLFGAIPAESFQMKLLGQDSIAIEVVAPSGTGTQPVTVITPRGASPVVDTCQYTFRAPPVLATVSFADQAVGTPSAAKTGRFPLGVSLHDLPPDRTVSYWGDNLSLKALLQFSGLGLQFTVGQLMAAYGDMTLTYAIAGLWLDRGPDRDFALQTDGAGNVSLSFKPIATGYRADVVRARVGGITVAASGLIGTFGSTLAPFFAPLLNDHLAILVEGNGI